MRRLTLLLTAVIAALAPIVLAQSTGPYKVLKTAKVGGEGGTDYIYRGHGRPAAVHHARRDAGAARRRIRGRRCLPSKSG